MRFACAAVLIIAAATVVAQQGAPTRIPPKTLFSAPLAEAPGKNLVVVELNYAPFGQPTSWRQPWANVRLGLQYTYFTRFSGLVHNIDGAGRNASANNTLYFYVWLAI